MSSIFKKTFLHYKITQIGARAALRGRRSFIFLIYALLRRGLHDFISYGRRRADTLAAVFDNNDDCQREILALGERDKPRMRLAVRDLRGAGLSAELKSGELALAVVGRDILSEHIFDGIRYIFVEIFERRRSQ